VRLVESFVLVHLSFARSTSDDGNGAGADPFLSSGEILVMRASLDIGLAY